MGYDNHAKNIQSFLFLSFFLPKCLKIDVPHMLRKSWESLSAREKMGQTNDSRLYRRYHT